MSNEGDKVADFWSGPPHLSWKSTRMKTKTIYAIGSYGRRPFIRLEKAKRGYKFFRLNYKGEETGVEYVRTMADGKAYAANLARLSHMTITD